MPMPLRPFALIGYAWIAFLGFWFVASFRVNRTVRGEGWAGISRRLVFVFLAFVVIVGDSHARLRPLNEQFAPRRLWIVELSALLTVAGVAFAIWARIHIGRYWSCNVFLKEGHHLIRTGPYSRFRHPIYTGLLLAMAGTTL